MTIGRVYPATAGAGGETAVVMYVQADQVTQAMREKHAAQSAGHGFFGADIDHIEVGEDACQQQVGLQMQFAVIQAWFDACTYLQLRFLHGRDHGLEIAVFRRVGSRDIGGIAIVLGAGIDQERQSFSRVFPFQGLVMQNRAVTVERDDVAVGELVLHVAGGFEVGEMDFELGRAIPKCLLCCKVAPATQFRCLAHAGELVFRFRGAMVVEMIDQGLRIDRA